MAILSPADDQPGFAELAGRADATVARSASRAPGASGDSYALIEAAGTVEGVHVDLMPIGARRLLGVLDAALSHRLDDSSQQIAPRVEWADPALQCRYADQAHLVRDVRCLAGVTPTEVARETFLQDADAASV